MVWQRYVRPSRWSSWSPQISSVDCTDEPIRPGSTGVVHAVLGVQVPFVVDQVDDLTLDWSWKVRLPLGIGLTLHHSVRVVPTGTRTELSVSGPLPIVLGYLPVAWLALVRLVRP